MTLARTVQFSGLSPELLKRLPFCAAAVLICYQFDWTWLRFLTSEATMYFAAWRGYTVQRLSPDLIAWNGQQFQFGIACTFADVFCGAVPLFWVRSTGILRNVANVIVLAGGLFAFNLLRQGATDLVFSAGVSWTLADNAIGALSYFGVWVFLVRWLERSSAITPLAAPTASAVAP